VGVPYCSAGDLWHIKMEAQIRLGEGKSMSRENHKIAIKNKTCLGEEWKSWSG